MAPDEPSGARPGPVVLRIKLRYDDVEAMVHRFAPNVGKSGLFLPTKSLQAVGAEIKFELRLADDTPVLVGLGRVKAAKAPDPANPKAAFGMAIELMRVTRESREVILKMLERRKAMGLPEVAIPHPADLDAARRSEADSAIRDATNNAVPRVAITIDTAPVLATLVSAETGPVMTAPRRNTGPIAIAKSHVVAALDPEPPRKKRSAVSEVIERASGPILVASAVQVPGLDDDIDVGAVLARARALAGGDLDAELEALREMSAAPLEIGIEAASAELAKQLGGAAVRRDRSAKWAPPPATISAPIEVPALEAKGEPESEPKPEPEVGAKVEPVPDVDPERIASSDVIELRDSTPIIDVDPDPDDDAEPDDHHEVDADQIADEIHQLGDGDVEEVDHTQVARLPSVDAAAFDQHVFATEPAVTADLERSLEQHLADAEAEADDLGILAGAPPPAEPVDEDVEEEIHDFEILAEADEEDADLMTAHGEQDASGVHKIALAETVFASDEPLTAPAHAPALARARPQPAIVPPEEPIPGNAHIPARIRAQHRRVSGQHAIIRSTPVAPEPEPEPEPPPEPDPADEFANEYIDPDRRASMSDFASRLDLSDEFEAAPESPEQTPVFSDRPVSLSELDPQLGELDPRSVSAGHALAAFEDSDDDFEGDGGFTIAANLSADSIEFDPPTADRAGFPALHAFDESDVIEPQVLMDPPRRAKPAAAAGDSYDLENALEALDVDLDDLSIPVEPPLPAMQHPRQPRAERVVPRRATTDIPIDFDDDFDED